MVNHPNARNYQDYRVTLHDIQLRTKHQDEASVDPHRHDSYPLIFNPSVQITIGTHLSVLVLTFRGLLARLRVGKIVQVL